MEGKKATAAAVSVYGLALQFLPAPAWTLLRCNLHVVLAILLPLLLLLLLLLVVIWDETGRRRVSVCGGVGSAAGGGVCGSSLCR